MVLSAQCPHRLHIRHHRGGDRADRGLTVIGLYIVLALAGWWVALRAPDRFGRMVAAGLTAWLTFQAIVNIGGVLGVVPITGIALPFVSFGSTSLIVCMASLGILVNIAQAGVQPKT